jgi:hypothetical protein
VELLVGDAEELGFLDVVGRAVVWLGLGFAAVLVAEGDGLGVGLGVAEGITKGT